MYNIFFPKSLLFALPGKKKSSCRMLYFLREISPWMLDPPVIARQREDQFILVTAILQAPNSDQSIDLTF